MNDYDRARSREETFPARPVSSATSGGPVAGSSGGVGAGPRGLAASSPDSSAWVTVAKQARRPRVGRLLSNRKSGGIVAAALVCAVIGVSAGCAASPSATAASPSSSATAGHPVPASGAAGGPLSGGGGSNARSGPAAGGAAGTVDSVSPSSFTITTSAGQKVTVNEASTTTYQDGTSSTSASAVTPGGPVLVLGTTNGTTITATQVVVH